MEHGAVTGADETVTPFTESNRNYEHPNLGEYYTYSWFTVWTAVEDEGIQLEAQSSTGTHSVDQVSITIINLDDTLVENTDWHYSFSSTDTSFSTATNSTFIGFTPTNATEDWLVMGYNRLATTTTTLQHNTFITSTGDFTETQPQISQAGEDGASDRMMHSLFRVFPELDTTYQQFSMQSSYESGTCTNCIVDSAILALNLDNFQAHSNYWNETAIDIDTTNSYATSTETSSSTITTGQTGDVFAMIGIIHDETHHIDGKTRMQFNNVDLPATQTSDAYTVPNNIWDVNDEIQIQIHGVVNIASGTYDIDSDTTGTTASRPKEDRSNVAFTMELAGEHWYNNNWVKSKKVTINSDRVTSTLTDFPLLVNITDTSVSKYAQSDCDDILFTNMNNITKYSHEIENCDLTANDWFTAWVKIPRISAIADTDFMMYYGNLGASNQENVADVWSNGFYWVQHLHDDFLDSSGNYDGTNSGSTDVAGKIADGQDFDGSSARITSNAASAGFNNELTISFWGEPDDVTTDQYMSDGSNSDSSVLLGFQDGSYNLFGTYYCAGGASDTEIPATVDTWQLIHFTMSQTADTFEGYKNGVERFDCNPTGIIDDFTSYEIGSVGAAAYYNGAIDEFRISDVERTPAWISLEWCNQSNSTCALSFSAESSHPDKANWYNASWEKARKIYTDSADFTSDLTDYPIYVNVTEINLGTDTLSNCNDIVFTDVLNITKLSHEIETCDTTGNILEAWLKLPIAFGNSTTFFLYYDNSGSGWQQDSLNVFPTQFEGVWHLNGTFLDTTGALDGTDVSTDAVSNEYLGDSRHFDDSADNIDLPVISTLTDWTISGWVLSQQPTSEDPFFGTDSAGWNDDVLIGIAPETTSFCTTATFCLAHQSDSGSVRTVAQGTTTAIIDTWYHVVGRGNTTHLQIYLNGAVEDTEPRHGSASDLNLGTDNGSIGSDRDVPLRRWDGYIDEVRLSNTALTADWIKSDYECQRQDNNNDCITIGSQGTNPDAGGGGSHSKSLAEDVAVEESLTRAGTFARSLAEDVAVEESLTYVCPTCSTGDTSKSITDDIALEESLTYVCPTCIVSTGTTGATSNPAIKEIILESEIPIEAIPTFIFTPVSVVASFAERIDYQDVVMFTLIALFIAIFLILYNQRRENKPGKSQHGNRPGTTGGNVRHVKKQKPHKVQTGKNKSSNRNYHNVKRVKPQKVQIPKQRTPKKVR